MIVLVSAVIKNIYIYKIKTEQHSILSRIITLYIVNKMTIVTHARYITYRYIDMDLILL